MPPTLSYLISSKTILFVPWKKERKKKQQQFLKLSNFVQGQKFERKLGMRIVQDLVEAADVTTIDTNVFIYPTKYLTGTYFMPTFTTCILP